MRRINSFRGLAQAVKDSYRKPGPSADHLTAQKRLMAAAFALGQAQRALEDAEADFKKALAESDAVNEAEGYGLLPASTVRQGESR